MKLLYTNFHSGSGGGHTTYVRELARNFSQSHEIHIAAPAGSRLLAEASAIPGVHLLSQPFPNGLRQLRERFRAIALLRGYLHLHRFDIVHVNGSADHRIVISALRGTSLHPLIVLTKHNTKPMRGLQHVLRARLHTSKVIAVCEYVRKQLEGTPYRFCHPQTVYNGVDTSLFAPWPDKEAHASRMQFMVNPSALVIGSSAGTAGYKGWIDLITALSLLDDLERRAIHVIIAGHPPSTGQLSMVRAAGLEAQFHFPGLLSDVRPMIAALDAGFVLSHDIETISFACREMMAMGKPVMVTDYAGLPENIHPDKDGWVVPVHGYKAIADVLREMLQHPERLRRMGIAARTHALEEFGIDHFTRATETIYANLLAD